MRAQVANTPFKRFSWSHDRAIHRIAVQFYNAILALVPFSVKYGIGKKLRAGIAPYRLIKPGAVVVQVGAPGDTLKAGRSRGMYFSLFAGDAGRVVLVEPDDQSQAAFRSVIERQGITNIRQSNCAAWSSEDTLKLWINDKHPASNFTDGTKQYDEKRMQDYRYVELPADKLDSIVKQHDIEQVDLVSITTNGAEREILEGLRETMAAGLPYICLAVTGKNYTGMMQEFGYELLEHDDRGFTFQQVKR